MEGAGDRGAATMPADARRLRTAPPGRRARIGGGSVVGACLSIFGIVIGGGCASTLPGPPDGGREWIVEASADATPTIVDEAGADAAE